MASVNDNSLQLRALQQHDVTSLDLVEATIARIEEADATTNAVVVRDFDRARQAALDADRERAATVRCSDCR